MNINESPKKMDVTKEDPAELKIIVNGEKVTVEEFTGLLPQKKIQYLITPQKTFVNTTKEKITQSIYQSVLPAYDLSQLQYLLHHGC